MNKAQSRLAALEWVCLALVTLGFNSGGARMPKPSRYVGVVFSFLIFGLVAELGQAAERLATAMGGVLTIALLLNKSISGIGASSPTGLIGALGSIPNYFGLQPDPEAPTGPPGWEENLGAIANFTGTGGAGGGGGGGRAW